MVRRGRNKRGLSDVVTTVLLILAVVAAVALIWAFLSSFLKSTDKIDTNTLNTGLSIQPESVIITYDGNVSFNAKMDYGEKIDRVKVTLTDNNGNSKEAYRNISFQKLDVKNIFIPGSEHHLNNITMIVVVPLIETGTGVQAGKTQGEYSINKRDLRLDRCGDGIVNSSAGEKCDAGASNGNQVFREGISYNGQGRYCANDTSTPEKNACQWSDYILGPKCGDNIIDSGNGEQCDNGTLNNQHCGVSPSLPYGVHNCIWCDSSCLRQYDIGTWCGDGILQISSGEECDPVIGVGNKKCTNAGYIKGSGVTCNTEGNPNLCKFNYANCQVPVQDIYGYWKFEESSWSGNGAVKDEKGINNGTSYNGAAIYSSGKSGKALDVSQGYIKMNGDSIKNKLENGFTVTFWIYPKSIPTTQKIILDNINSPTGGLKVTISPFSDSGYSLYNSIITVYGSDENNGYCSMQSIIDTNNWNLVSVSYDESKVGTRSGIKVYINGGYLNPANWPYTNLMPDWACKAGIYNSNKDLVTGSNIFDGYLDEFIFYNRTLTDSEILSIYTNT